MRIVGGIWKGRSIEAPQGRGTRPTTDRTREAISSMILSACNLSLEGLTILDAYAGSGALSFELLSRGAERAILVDANRKVTQLIRQNAMQLKAQDRVQIICGDVARLVEQDGLSAYGPYNVLLLDPPYVQPPDEVATLINTMRDKDFLSKDCLVLYEHASLQETFELNGATILKHKVYGTTAVDLLKLNGSSSN